MNLKKIKFIMDSASELTEFAKRKISRSIENNPEGPLSSFSISLPYAVKNLSQFKEDVLDYLIKIIYSSDEKYESDLNHGYGPQISCEVNGNRTIINYSFNY